jgi:hypothetical protein
MDKRPRAAVARLDARGGELVGDDEPLDDDDCVLSLPPAPPPLSSLLLLLLHSIPKEE